MDFTKTSIEGLPLVVLDGKTMYIRALNGLESAEVLDDCQAYARLTTPENLRGQKPNPLKLQLLEVMMGDAEGSAQIVGKVDKEDAYEVNFAYCIAAHLAAFQAARALVFEDGSDAFPTFETRAVFAHATSRREDLLVQIEVAKSKLPIDPIPNDSPADSQE
jgi:hypothetical protein